MDREAEKARARKRRNNKFRMRRKARRFFEWSGWWDYIRSKDIESEKRLRSCMFADNMAKCSCCMCGNPRRNGMGTGDTMQEKRLRDLAKEQLKELEGEG